MIKHKSASIAFDKRTSDETWEKVFDDLAEWAYDKSWFFHFNTPAISACDKVMDVSLINWWIPDVVIYNVLGRWFEKQNVKFDMTIKKEVFN